MKRTRLIYALFAFCCLSGEAFAFTCPQPPPKRAVCGNPDEFQSCGIMVNGINRHFCIHVPGAGPADITRNMPVVLAFHGGSGDASKQVSIWEKHTEQGMVIVAPSALVTMNLGKCVPHWRHIGIGNTATWTDLADPDPCGTKGGPPILGDYASPPYQSGGSMRDDLLFVRRLINAIDADPDIAPTGHYTAGFSNGAGMVYQLFITQSFAQRFDGFAAVSNVMSDAKIAAQAAAGGAGFSANHDVKKPFIFTIGTNEKPNSPAENIISSVEQLVTDGVCTVADVRDAITCWIDHETYPGEGKFGMVTPASRTTEWLVNHNNSELRDIESLYPDLGHGSAPLNVSDQTLVVRQEFPRKSCANESEPVAVLTIIGGVHQWPGSKGGYPPCSGISCDLDGTEAILQFWRANAGFLSQWR